MKKKILLFTLVLITFILTACFKKEPEEVPKEVFFTKYFESASTWDTALELYNQSSEYINLSDYKIVIYSNGSLTPSYTVELEGVIKPKDFFVVSSTYLESEVLQAKTDMMSSNLIFNGDDAIRLTKGSIVIDALGDIGSTVEFARDVTLIKKLEYLDAYSNYEGYNYIRYKVDAYDYLKTFDDILTNEELIDGPKLDDIDPTLPLIDEQTGFGTGGFVEVTLQSVADGDTARFMFPAPLYSQSVRYAYNNTTEVIGSGSLTGDPWAYKASHFNLNNLNNASTNGDKIRIQSLAGESMSGGYDRLMALVWVGNRLLNYENVRAGLTYSGVLGTVSERIQQMSYRDVPFTSFMDNAERRAQLNSWGINTLDDKYDYNAGRPTITDRNDPQLAIDPRHFNSLWDR